MSCYPQRPQALVLVGGLRPGLQVERPPAVYGLPVLNGQLTDQIRL